jgi:MFS family permease
VNSGDGFIGWGSMAFAPLLAGLLVSGSEPLVGREWALRLPFILTGVLSLVAVAATWTRIASAVVATSEAAERS